MIGVGDMVVCVDDKYNDTPYPGEVFPREDEIYTVREVVDGGLRLEEIRNPKYFHIEGFTESTFLISRFRKIAKPSIKLFRDIAANPKILVDA